MMPVVSSLSLESVNLWLEKRRRFVLTLLLLLALCVRGMYLFQLWSSPCAWQHRWAETDMYFFDLWAKKIVAGDYLTAQPLHPYPDWTMTVAEDYFRIYPEQEPMFQQKVVNNAEGRGAKHELWDEWYCAPCFHQEPVYPYLLAFTYKLFGPDPRCVFVWQCMLGLASLLLLYLLTIRLFDDLTAVVTSFLAILSGPLLLYEGVLLRDNLVIVCSLGLALLLSLSVSDRKPAWYLWSGMWFGFALLVKTIFMPLVLIQSLLLLFRDGRVVGLRSVRNASIFLAGVMLCLVPLVVRNIYVGASPFSFCSANAFTSTFINSNAGDSSPGHGYCISRYFARIMGETRGKQIAVIVKTVGTHSSASGFIRMMWDKWAALWHWYEQPNNVNFYYYRLHIPLLEYLPVTFFLISPLSLMGLVLAAGELRRRWPLYLVAANILGILMVGLVLARYRVSFQALMMPFAACALISIVSALVHRQYRVFVGMVAVFALLAFWTMRPLPPSRPLIRSADYSAAYLAYYSPNAVAAIQAGRWDLAAVIMRASLVYEPQVVKTMGLARPARNNEESALAELYSQVYGRIGEALKNSGKYEESNTETRRSIELQSVADAFKVRANP